jgi:exosortase/archaeosortase family protein
LQSVEYLSGKIGSFWGLSKGSIDISDISGTYFQTACLTIKWLIVSLLIIWVLKVKNKEKIVFTGLLILYNYCINISQVLVYVVIYNSGNPFVKANAFIDFSITLLHFLFLSLFFYRNKETGYIYLKEYINPGQYIKVLRNVFIVIVISLFYWTFIRIYFDFVGLAKELVFISQKILLLFGFNPGLEGDCLLGEYGNVCVWKDCLGLKTMFVYALFIYFTGVKLFPKIVYISIGIVIFNFFNILRFVSIYWHYQVYKDFQKATDFHDSLKYPLYLVIVILWVIWLNKYSDIWPYTNKKESNPINF